MLHVDADKRPDYMYTNWVYALLKYCYNIDVKIIKYHTLGPAAPSRYCINNLLRHHHHEEDDDGVTNMSRGV